MRMLITAGPTREPIDEVRFISNRSSGKMGISLAQAAVEAGNDVALLLGPGPSPRDYPCGCRVERFIDSGQLLRLLELEFPHHDVLVMAAAIVDFRPPHASVGKPKLDKNKPITLQLEPTPDLVAKMASGKLPTQKVVAFALEEEQNLQANATRKLCDKGVDAIVANALDSMDADTIEPVWLTADGKHAAPGRMSKIDFAQWLLKRIEML